VSKIIKNNEKKAKFYEKKPQKCSKNTKNQRKFVLFRGEFWV